MGRRAVRARYEGTCHLCGDRVYAGHWVVRWTPGWVHEQCGEEEAREIVDRLERLDPTPVNTLPVDRSGRSTRAFKDQSASRYKR